jgi:integrase
MGIEPTTFSLGIRVFLFPQHSYTWISFHNCLWLLDFVAASFPFVLRAAPHRGDTKIEGGRTMPVVRLDRRAIADVGSVERLTVLYDQELKGFGLRVTPRGARSWIIEYRPGGGRGTAKRRLALGSAAAITPEEARNRAKKLLARVALGEDPAAERTAARRAASVDDLLSVYMNEKIRTTRKPRTAQVFASYIKNNLRPALGRRNASTLTRLDVVRVHRAVGASYPVTANRIVSVLGAAYAYGAKTGILPNGLQNPARGVDKYREQGRERYLTLEEMRRLGEALRLAETEGIPWDPTPLKRVKHAPKAENRRVIFDRFAVDAIRLLLLTGCRLREILELRWSEVDLERGLLRLSDSKTGKKTILLGASAAEILSVLPRAGVFVIAGTSRRIDVINGQERVIERPRSDLNRPWARIRAHARLAGVRLHDLRHSFASIGAGSGLGLPIIGRLLGHTRPETTARYSHLADDPLRRACDIIGETIAAALGAHTHNSTRAPDLPVAERSRSYGDVDLVGMPIGSKRDRSAAV